MSQLLTAFGTAFVGIGFLCAPLGAVVTFVMYVFFGVHEPLPSIWAGLLASAAVAVAIVLAYDRRYQHAKDVYPDQYRHLMRRLQSAEHRLELFASGKAQGLVAAAQKDAERIKEELTELLEKPSRGSRWISASGYLEAWSDLNRLEESLLFLLPCHQVVALAKDDQSRLKGSGMDRDSNLSGRLGESIAQLAPTQGAVAVSEDQELSARADLVLVRNSINRAREDKWGQLVGARNNMMLAAAIAGVIAYLALISVIVWRIEPKALQVAAAFVITGCLISLLHQLTLVGSSSGGVADFGQSTARLLSATFVSGLIALLGVVILEGVNLTVNGSALLSSHSHWAQTFDWTVDRGGFFWAASFGLAPSALFQALQTRTDAIKNSLNASRATGGA